MDKSKKATSAKNVPSTTNGGSRILTRSYARAVIDGMVKEKGPVKVNELPGKDTQPKKTVLEKKSNERSKKIEKKKNKKNNKKKIQSLPTSKKISLRGLLRRKIFFLRMSRVWRFLRRLRTLSWMSEKQEMRRPRTLTTRLLLQLQPRY